jgi:hypothetical protein
VAELWQTLWQTFPHNHAGCGRVGRLFSVFWRKEKEKPEKFYKKLKNSAKSARTLMNTE